MGLAPAQVRTMTFWEFAHAATAFAVFHGAKADDVATEADMAAMDAMLAAAPATLR